MRRYTLPQIPTLVYRSRVVDPSCSIIRRYITRSRFIQTLCKSISSSCACRAVRYHLRDRCCWTRVFHGDLPCAGFGPAGPGSVVGLHYSGIDDPAVGGRNADTAARFLKHDSEDEAVVYIRGGGDGFNGIIDGCHFRGGVVCETVLVAGLLEDPFTIVEHIHERDPARIGGPTLRYGAIAVVLSVVVY